MLLYEMHPSGMWFSRSWYIEKQDSIDSDGDADGSWHVFNLNHDINVSGSNEPMQ